MQRVLFVGLVCTLLTVASGCGVCHSILYEPFGPGTMCRGGGCGPTDCGPTDCGFTDCGPADLCGPECGGCGVCTEVPCGPAADPCCRPWGPLGWLFSGPRFSCGQGGCGKIYWGDFHGDPPLCNDPCRQCGSQISHHDSGGGCASCGATVSSGTMHVVPEASEIPSQSGPWSVRGEPRRLSPHISHRPRAAVQR